MAGGKPSGAIAAVLVGAPVLAAIVFLTLLRGEQIDTQQQLERVRIEQDRARFDQTHNAALNAFGVTPLPPGETSPRAAELEARRRQLEAEAEAQRLKVRDTMQQIEDELQKQNENAEAARAAVEKLREQKQ